MLENLIKEAFAGLDKDGYFPPQPCKKCGTPLQGQGSGRPAELYAGTFTGLCYSCTNGPGFVLRTDDLDGLVTWSYPPHYPAWRRDRETFSGYPDCQTCKGSGRLYVSRDFGMGGPYYTYCDLCMKRQRAHPFRKWQRERRDRIFRVAQSTFETKCIKRGLMKRNRKGLIEMVNFPDDGLIKTEDVLNSIRQPIVARHQAAMERFEALIPIVRARFLVR